MFISFRMKRSRGLGAAWEGSFEGFLILRVFWRSGGCGGCRGDLPELPQGLGGIIRGGAKFRKKLKAWGVRLAQVVNVLNVLNLLNVLN